MYLSFSFMPISTEIKQLKIFLKVILLGGWHYRFLSYTFFSCSIVSVIFKKGLHFFLRKFKLRHSSTWMQKESFRGHVCGDTWILSIIRTHQEEAHLHSLCLVTSFKHRHTDDRVFQGDLRTWCPPYLYGSNHSWTLTECGFWSWPH